MNRTFFEKLGTVGAVILAAACPICFPKIALVGAVVGLGTFAPYEGYLVIAAQALFVLAMIGQILVFPRHRNVWLLMLSVGTTVLMFAAYYIFASTVALQLSLLGLAVASVWQIAELKRCARCSSRSKGADG